MKKAMSVLLISMFVYSSTISVIADGCNVSNEQCVKEFNGQSYFMEDGVPVKYVNGEKVALLLPLAEYAVTDSEDLAYLNAAEQSNSVLRSGSLDRYEVGDSYSSGISMEVLCDPVTPIFNVSLTSKQSIKFYPYNISGVNKITTKVYYKIVSWNEGAAHTQWYNFVLPSYYLFSVSSINSSITQFYIKFIKDETSATDFDYTVSKEVISL